MDTAGDPSSAAASVPCLDGPDGDTFDVAIVGGGPAGSALAAHLARSGRRTALIERDFFPRDKLCGEFLSMEAQNLLASLGCLEDMIALEPARIRRARFTTASGRTLEAAFPADCLGIGRMGLDAVLFRHAGRCGAALFVGTEVTEILSPGVEPGDGVRTSLAGLGLRPRGAGKPGEARVLRAAVLAGAWGRREALDRKLRRAFISRDHPFLGLKRHLVYTEGDAGAEAREELAGTVEIHAFEGGYCGLNPIESGAVNLCVLLEKRAMERIGSSRWEVFSVALAEANPRLRDRLRGLEPAGDRVLGVGGVPFSSKERSVGPVLLLGDAAGMIAPFCGDGQSMALESAALLAKLLESLPRRPSPAQLEALGREWDRSWRVAFGRRMRLGRVIQRLLFRAPLADLALRALHPFPSLARLLVRWTRGQ